MPFVASAALALALTASLPACTPGQALMVGGGTIALGGAAAIGTRDDCSNSDVFGCELDNDIQLAGGGALLVTGLVVAVLGMVVESRDREQEANTLALQTSKAAVRGDCDMARATARQLAARDSAVLQQLVTYNTAVASCVTVVAFP